MKISPVVHRRVPGGRTGRSVVSTPLPPTGHPRGVERACRVARPGVATDMPTPLPTPVVAVGTARRHRERRKSLGISIVYARASGKLRPRRGYVFCLCVVISRTCGAPVGKKDLICDRWCLGPIDLKVEGPSFASEGTTSHGRWSEYKAEGTPASAWRSPCGKPQAG